MNHIGKRIKFLRQSKCMTQKELGQILGVKKAAVQKYEASPDPNLSAEKIRLLCTTFDVYPRTFIFPDLNDAWDQVLGAWERTQASGDRPPLTFPDHMPRIYAQAPRIEDTFGMNISRLLLDVLLLNNEGIKRVQAHVSDLHKIEEYRLDGQRITGKPQGCGRPPHSD